MIYILLNIALVAFFLYFTHLFDSRSVSENIANSDFSISILLASIEGIIFTLALVFNNVWNPAFIVLAMRVAYMLDIFFMIKLSFALIDMGTNKKSKGRMIIQIFLGILGTYIVWAKIKNINLSLEGGFSPVAEFIFKRPAEDYFPWTWVHLYQALYKVIIPVFCFLSLVTIQEKKATQLEKYQTVIIAESFVLMWAVSLVVNYLSTANPGFHRLDMLPYLFMFLMIYSAITTTSVPSGRGFVVTIIKSLLTYFIPAFVVGTVCSTFQPVGNYMIPSYLVVVGIVSIAGIIFSFRINEWLTNSAKFYTSDYEGQLEKDLGTLDYSDAEMDQITARMYEIIKKNVESSSMNVFISDKQGFEIAYSSNNLNVKLDSEGAVFDSLLNLGKNIVVRSSLETNHELSDVAAALNEFFDKTKSDALFLLNEGHNLFGLITLGIKVSGDQYKEYDFNAFSKLYSYFFVFGYFMRNIANKDIMGIVNREIKMSSQIITSIQENIDLLDNPKMDVGYKMVPSHNIGGEFIDLIRLTDTRHLFVVGDLSGKGIAASMNMVILKSIIRTFLAETHDFKELIVKINTFIRNSLPKGTIFAGLFALVDFEKDTMYYINCGIPALMMYTRVYNNVIEIQGSGHILGFVKDISPYISVKTTKLNSGDILLACTDGLVQSHSLRGEMFGKERIQQAILDNSTYPAQRMAQFTFDTLLKFMSKEMEDDVSILVIKYESDNTSGSEAGNVPSEEKIESNIEISEETAPIEAFDDSAALEEGSVKKTEEIESESEDTVSEKSENTEEKPVEEKTLEEKPEKSKPAEPPKLVHDAPPEGFDMSELSDLDALMAEAGL